MTQLCDSGICCAARVYRAYPGRLGRLAPGEASGADKASSTPERDVCAVALSLLALIVRRFRGASPLGEGIERSSKERKAHAARAQEKHECALTEASQLRAATTTAPGWI